MVSHSRSPIQARVTKFLYHPLINYPSHVNIPYILNTTPRRRLEMNMNIDFRRDIIITLTSHIRCVVFERKESSIGIELEENGLVGFFDHAIEPRPTSLF